MAKTSGKIHIKKSKQGSLHTAVGVKQGDKIPASKLAIKASDSPALKKKKQFAINASKWHHQTGGYDEAGQLMHDYEMNNPVEEGLEGGPGAPDYSNAQYQPINSQVDTSNFQPINVADSIQGGPQQLQIQGQAQPVQQKGNWRAKGRNIMGYVNAGAKIVTGIANSINDKNMRQDEYRRLIRSQVNYQPNMESEGLDNMPAYTKYGGKLIQRKMGGPIKHGSPVGVVEFKASRGYHDDEMETGQRTKAFYDGAMEYEGGEPFQFQAGGAIEPHYEFPKYINPNATDSATYRKDFYDVLYGNPAALEKLQQMDGNPNGLPFQKSSNVTDQVPTAKEIAYRDAQNQIMKKKGKKQAGGCVYKNQAGGTPAGPNPAPVNPPATPPADPNDPNGVYAANATLAYFKNQLNDKLRAKDPAAYDQYQAGFNDIQNQYKSGKLPATQVIPARQKYVTDSQYNQALSPEEVQGALGDQYQTYLQSLQTVNQANVSRGQKPLYGDIEGDQDVTKLNYGRRFAAVTTNPSVSATTKNSKGVPTRTVNTNYVYDPNAHKVNSSQSVVQYDENGNPITAKQAGGYAVGQEVNLTAKQIADLKKQGYKIENI